ncbi:MAG: FecR domain-containing protein [Acidobacteria bacterium]|nr:FecR domain-containing protein [Acidobacteriota bacterium]
MKTRSSFVCSLVLLVSLALVVPPDISSQAGQRAGQVSRVIPAVNLQRGAQRLAAAAQAPVFWEDVVNSQRNARARIALDDGSVLNVGAESSLRVTKHDPGAQQTELELTYGRVRSKAVRLARPGGKFEVRTPAGVAGVVGTDFYLAFLSGLLQLLVFEGRVRFCNLQGQCVEVAAGQTSTIRGTQAPDAPILATSLQLTEAAQSTDIQEPTEAAPRHLKPWQVVGLVILAAAPAIAVPLATRGQSGAAPAGKPCVPNPNTGRCP